MERIVRTFSGSTCPLPSAECCTWGIPRKVSLGKVDSSESRSLLGSKRHPNSTTALVGYVAFTAYIQTENRSRTAST